MQVAAVYSCVRIISETVASLPLHIYKRASDGSRTRDVMHPLYSLLHDTPNEYQTAMEFRELMQANLCLRGNAYAFINWTSDSVASELLPLTPDRVTVQVAKDGSRKYVLEAGSEKRLIDPSDMLHIRGLSSDGVLGRSPISDAREAIGVAMSTQEYAATFYKNDATPAVVLKHPGKLGADAGRRLKEQWNEVFGGAGKSRGTAVIEEGMSIERMSLTAEDAQFLETRKFQRSEIAGLFRVPPHMIGDLDRATFGNIEHQSIEFVTHCIRPWLVRWEQALSKALFTAPGLYYPEHNVEGLLRGDIKSRYDAYAIGRNWGWLSANDIRSMENQNPIADGDIYLQPMNMNRAGQTNA